MKVAMNIQTNRLHLRSLNAEDATETYVGWLNDPAVNQFLETRHATQTIDSCKQFITTCNNSETEHLFGIFLKSTGAHIGNAKLGCINLIHQRGEISLFIGDKAQWGKKLATEVVTALTSYGFNNLGLEKIEAGCYQDNIGSLRTFLGIGYTVEGFFRSHSNLNSDTRSGCFWLGMLKSEHITNGK